MEDSPADSAMATLADVLGGWWLGEAPNPTGRPLPGTLAPHQVRANVFAREAVASLLATARRAAGGRDLRGLAWRMGVAPAG